MLRAQQGDDPEIQGLLNRRQARVELLETRAEELRSLLLPVGVRKLGHQQEQQFRVLRRGDAVDRLEILQVRVVGLRDRGRPTSKEGGRPDDEQQNTQQDREALQRQKRSNVLVAQEEA